MIDPSKLVAHRGYQAKYPENTRLSLTKAIEAGALFIELDVQFSADQLPIIYHDTDLHRVSGSPTNVFATSRQELMTCPAYEPERLGDKFIDEKISPLEYLVDILQANPQVIAFVELKEESIDHCGRELITAKVQEILEPVAAQCVIMSFDYELATQSRDSGWPMVGVVLQKWEDLSHPDINLAQPDYIYTNYKIIPETPELGSIEALVSAKLVAYETDSAELGQRLLDLGVDMLETFEIETLIGLQSS